MTLPEAENDPMDDLGGFVGHWLAADGPADTVILTGAGVSANPPTRLPLGAELMRRVFDQFFEPVALDTLLALHRDFGLELPRPCDTGRDVRPPRLETVLGVAVDAYGLSGAMQVLDDVRSAQPNLVHRILAAHLRAGGSQLTANFDDCIEQSDRGAATGHRIWHFHGSFAEDPTGASLGATLRAIERGFDDEDAERFRATLRACRRLVVLGYSGSDYFDVDTTVAMLERGELRGREVLWVAHQSAGWAYRRAGDTDVPLMRLLERMGAKVTVLCAPTIEVCTAVATHWSLEVPHPDPERGRPPPLPPVIAPTPAAREAATFQLYRQFRLHRHVGELLARPRLSVPPEERFRATADILWDGGKFATARRLWRNAKSVPRWERAERVGACLWEQGRLVPAYFWLACHRHVGQSPVERLRIDETMARVVLRMARSPDTRWLGRALAPRVRARLGTVTQRAGLDMFRRANDVIRQLDQVADPLATAGDAATSSDWFLEAGDLAGLLAYRHSYYRRSYEPGIPTSVLVDRYRKLQTDKDRVGSVGARVMFLPGAERVYSIREVVAGLFESQFGPWHRVRLLASFGAARARHLVRARRTRPSEGDRS